jgi:hypothetical protein
MTPPPRIDEEKAMVRQKSPDAIIRKEPYGQTTVPAQRSIGEIVGTLVEAGAEAIQQTEFPTRGFVLRFHLKGRSYCVPVRYRYATERGQRQALRWLLHYLKTLLEAEMFAPLEQLLLAYVEIEDEEGTSTIGQWLLPQLNHLERPPMLPGVLESDIEEIVEGELLPPPPREEEE